MSRSLAKRPRHDASIWELVVYLTRLLLWMAIWRLQSRKKSKELPPAPEPVDSEDSGELYQLSMIKIPLQPDTRPQPIRPPENRPFGIVVDHRFSIDLERKRSASAKALGRE